MIDSVTSSEPKSVFQSLISVNTIRLGEGRITGGMLLIRTNASHRATR